MLGLPQRSHNDECRLRIQRSLMETEEGKQRVQRALDRMEKDYSNKGKKKRKAEQSRSSRPWKVNLLKARLPRKRRLEHRSKGQAQCRTTVLDKGRRNATPSSTSRTFTGRARYRRAGDRRSKPARWRLRVRRRSTDLSYKQVQEADQMDDVSHLEKEFHSRGTRCMRKEAEVISSLVGSLDVDAKASVPLNEGLCLSVEDKGWKLQKQNEVEALFKLLEAEKPTLMVGLPPDGPFAGVQRSYNSLQKAKKEKEKEVLEAGRKQVRTCVEAYRYQVGTTEVLPSRMPQGSKVLGAYSVPTTE